MKEYLKSTVKQAFSDKRRGYSTHSVKRIFSTFLGITILTTTFITASLPITGVSVHAGSGKNATNTLIGTTDIKKPNEDGTGGWSKVYFGTYSHQPVLYRVLDPSTTIFTSANEPTMLLDCDSALLTMAHRPDPMPVGYRYNWANSEIRTWLNGNEFLGDENNPQGAFTFQERKAIASSTKDRAAEGDGHGHGNLGYAPLASEHIFLLDAVEATRSSYGYAPFDNEQATRVKSDSLWWLRSPHSSFSVDAGDVNRRGMVSMDSDNSIIGVSPAFNLNLSSVVFSSAISGTMGATNTVYTLTLKDENISATIDQDNITRSDAGVISVPYSSVVPDMCSHLAVLMTDKAYTDGNTNRATIKYYTALTPAGNALGTEGSATFTLPNDYDSSWYAYIVPERRINGNYTDYAGTFIPITIPDPPAQTYTVEVSASPKEGGNPTVALPEGTPAQKVSAEPETQVKLKANPSDDYDFIEWKVISPEGAQAKIDEPSSKETTYLTSSENAKIQAIYEKHEPGKHKVTVKANPKEGGEAKVRLPGGEYRTEVQDVKDTKVQLKAEEKDNYHFKEWKKISGNGELKNKDSKDNATYIIGTDDAEIEAIFEGDEPVPPKPEQHTITFIVDGKEIKAETDENGKLKEFPPDPEKEGYVFAGWYDAEEGGARIREDTVFTEDTKVYAHWNKEKPKPKPHKHDVDDDGSSEEPVKAAVVNPDALIAQFLVNGVKLDTAKFGKQVQGPMGQATFNAGRPLGWQQAFTFNMTVADKADYSIKNGYLILTIPQEYQKEGRTFAIMGLDQNGTPHIFNDTDTIPSTVTAKVNLGGYAFALIYKD